MSEQIWKYSMTWIDSNYNKMTLPCKNEKEVIKQIKLLLPELNGNINISRIPIDKPKPTHK